MKVTVDVYDPKTNKHSTREVCEEVCINIEIDGKEFHLIENTVNGELCLGINTTGDLFVLPWATNSVKLFNKKQGG